MYVPTSVYGKNASFKWRHPSIRMEYRRAYPRDPPTPSARRAHLTETKKAQAGPSSPPIPPTPNSSPTKAPQVYPRRKVQVQTMQERRRTAVQRSIKRAVVAPELTHLPGAFPGQHSTTTIPGNPSPSSPSPPSPSLKGMKAQEMPTGMGEEARALIKELKELGLNEEDRTMLHALDEADYRGEIRGCWHMNEVALTEAHEEQPLRDKYAVLLKSQNAKHEKVREWLENGVENVLSAAEQRQLEEERMEVEQRDERREAERRKRADADAARVDAWAKEEEERFARMQRMAEAEEARVQQEKVRRRQEKEERRQQEKQRRKEEARLRETERLRLIEERTQLEQQRREREAEQRRLEEATRMREEAERRAQEQEEAADRERLRLHAELRRVQQERAEAQRAAAEEAALTERLVREERQRAADELREATEHANAMIAEIEREHAATEAFARAAEERAQLIQAQLNAMAAQQWSVVEELRQRLQASWAEQAFLEQAFRQQQATFAHVRAQYEEQQRRIEEEAWRRAQEEARAEWLRQQAEAQVRQQAEAREAEARAERERAWGINLCKEYENRWAQLKSKIQGDNKLVDCVPYAEFPLPVVPLPPYNLDVAWPASAAPGAITYERVYQFIFSELRVDVKGKTQKELLKTEMLRWHPDKFEGQMMGTIRPSDKAAMREAAAAISRILNDIKEEIK